MFPVMASEAAQESYCNILSRVQNVESNWFCHAHHVIRSTHQMPPSQICHAMPHGTSPRSPKYGYWGNETLSATLYVHDPSCRYP
ncbi:hypothetical protein E2C01_041203 [Portunus trituberculatus]|uniref:Uncharacterized protein n=1 Tax=Portunus trituberculatus TaxID=210409 RepID=A0A5B7FPS5_PORTR|nr:hypothetical protein [Portunus trituberculatus]